MCAKVLSGIRPWLRACDISLHGGTTLQGDYKPPTLTLI